MRSVKERLEIIPFYKFEECVDDLVKHMDNLITGEGVDVGKEVVICSLLYPHGKVTLGINKLGVHVTSYCDLYDSKMMEIEGEYLRPTPGVFDVYKWYKEKMVEVATSTIENTTCDFLTGNHDYIEYKVIECYGDGYGTGRVWREEDKTEALKRAKEYAEVNPSLMYEVYVEYHGIYLSDGLVEEELETTVYGANVEED